MTQPDATDPPNPFADHVEQLATRLKRLERIGRWITVDPGLAVDLRHALASIPAVADMDDLAVGLVANEASTAPDDGTNFDRVMAHFMEHNNAWISAPALGKALGLYRGSVAHVVWSQHADKFEQKAGAGAGKVKLWRVKPDYLAEFASKL